MALQPLPLPNLANEHSAASDFSDRPTMKKDILTSHCSKQSQEARSPLTVQA